MPQQPKIGANVLETLTTGMYTEPLDSIREFVQNSADSIRQAEVARFLKRGEGRIIVDLDPDKRRLVIRDNGIGVKCAEAYERLVNIGMSDKSIGTDAGFRGIGRLAGIAYCEALRFRTSAEGEDQVTSVEFDCAGIRKAIAPSKRRTEELASVMERHTQRSVHSGKAGDHFFEVIMEGITPSGQAFLDWKALEDYLSQVAPVDFDPSFVFATKIKQWARTHKLDIPVVNVLLTGAVNRQIHKPYKGFYKTCRQRQEQFTVEIRDVDFCDDKGEQARYWIWYGITDLLGTIGDERVAGLRFRKHNIALGGPDRVADLFAEGTATNRRFNAWYVGEVHILAEDVIPNARRDGFEHGSSWQELKTHLLPFLKQRCSDAHSASSARNTPTQKVVRSAETVIAKAAERIEGGIVSSTERDSLLTSVGKEKAKVEAWIESRADHDEIRGVKPLAKTLTQLEQKLRDENNFAVRNVKSTLDRKQRKTLRDVLAVMHEVLTEQKCNQKEACYEAVRKAVLKRFQTSNGSDD